jgi:opacity protein-like surface antigen
MENTFMKRINLLICLIGFSTMLHAQLSMDIETGFIKVNSNDASSSWKNSLGDLNGLEGTLFSYAKDFQNPIKPLLRVRASYQFGETNRHVLSFLAAPLQYSCTGSFEDTVIFNSKTFTPGATVEGFYKFSGYRLTYRYMLCHSEKLQLGLGLTVNYRDAEFSLKQGSQYERNYNRGFVPLINTYLNYTCANKLGFLIDGDVFYIDKTGGAIDYLIGLNYAPSKPLSLKLGYRFFSGVGSEIGNVYNRLFVSSAVIGGVYTF